MLSYVGVLIVFVWLSSSFKEKAKKSFPQKFIFNSNWIFSVKLFVCIKNFYSFVFYFSPNFNAYKRRRKTRKIIAYENEVYLNFTSCETCLESVFHIFTYKHSWQSHKPLFIYSLTYDFLLILCACNWADDADDHKGNSS